MSDKTFDVIIIGAGSIGVPSAMYMAERKLKVLVIDVMPSPGQGQNKGAIGGVRATHSDPSKIKVALDSIKTFGTWKETYGDDIEWSKGGYTFVCYTKDDEKRMKDLLQIQQKAGLNIKWADASEIKEIVPGINPEGLLGGTYSPDDGNASPLLSINAFYKRAKSLGAKFNFNEEVTAIETKNGKIHSVKTSKGEYFCKFLLNAAGGNAREISNMVKMDLPVIPDSHEGGITEPVEKMFSPMVVDVRPYKNSQNFYFYQNPKGQIIFCMTPNPLIKGKNSNSTSEFLPLICKRMISLVPSLANIKVRRTWRGLYPMTPDGFPIVSAFENPKGYIAAVGMCGQGYMLGPGIAKLLAKMVTNSLTAKDKNVLSGFSHTRKFDSAETYK
jgi:glycine/D-amino acid oxidase-like deaminating enzyme